MEKITLRTRIIWKCFRAKSYAKNTIQLLCRVHLVRKIRLFFSHWELKNLLSMKKCHFRDKSRLEIFFKLKVLPETFFTFYAWHNWYEKCNFIFFHSDFRNLLSIKNIFEKKVLAEIFFTFNVENYLYEKANFIFLHYDVTELWGIEKNKFRH